MRKLLIPKMIEVLVAVVIVTIVSVIWYLIRSTAVLRSSVNLPAAPVHVAPTEGKKKKLQQSQIVLRQAEPRDTLVLFGTTTGNSWQLAEQLVRTGQARFGLTMRSQSLEDYDFESELHRESAVVVIVPTYDNGTPNATTKDFYDYLKECEHDFRVSKQLLERTSFAVFGLGDTVYGDNFCVVARRIDEWLKGLGGNRMLARGAGDAQYSTKQFETWMGRLWPSLLAALGEKGKLAALRNELKSQKKASALKFAYVSDEENEDKEPLADVEDLDVKKVEGGEDGDDDDDSVEETLEYGKQLLTPSLRTALSKQGYQLIGSHSGVKLCRWTKAMLRGRGGCYKHTFYNITSYACMEMTPSLACANKCVFCWRHGKNPVAKEWKWEMDKPEFLIEQSISKHQDMIRECKGVPGVIPERYNDAFTVRHCALSLVGEPIIYPQINRFVDLLHERRISSFMVTNAQFPKELEMLKPVTQLYLSIDAATPESLKEIDRPVHKDYWERFLASIDVLRNKQQRTVFRLTLVKEWNMAEMQDYAKLIHRGMPEFIEVKGVTYCGNNKTSSLTIKNTPYHEEVCVFVQQLAEEANKLCGDGTYRLCAVHEHSVCFLIAHTKFFIDGAWNTFIDYDKFHELVQSGKPFTSLDYVAKTPSWALFGSKEKGFDPEETRVFRKGKEGKRDELYANQGC